MHKVVAFYNEIDQQCCAWLSNLMDSGLITPGVICDKSIEDIVPKSLVRFDRVHMFAGIGGWDLALNLAGWRHEHHGRVWTGSAPCQSFSVAGKGLGFADKRHLWPAWFHLIRELAPPVVFGEQVAAAIRHGWLDLVSADLEGAGYAIGSAVLGAHSVGAPHIRQRLYFVAESNVIASRQGRQDNGRCDPRGDAQSRAGLGRGSGARLAQQFGERGTPREALGRPAQQAAERAGAPVGSLVQSDIDGSLAWDGATTTAGHGRSAEPASFWPGVNWIGCRDGKSRPVKSGLQCLANGVSARVVRLRGYGNAIVPQTAAAFIGAYMDCNQIDRIEIAA